MSRAAQFRRASARALARSSLRIEQSNALLIRGQIDGSDMARRRSDEILAQARMWDEIGFRLAARAAELDVTDERMAAIFGVTRPIYVGVQGAA